MGTYSTWEHYETFGGWPEPGETYVPLEDIDTVRKAAREDGDGANGYRVACPGPGCWCGPCRETP